MVVHPNENGNPLLEVVGGVNTHNRPGGCNWDTPDRGKFTAGIGKYHEVVDEPWRAVSSPANVDGS
jgi:hypothetical protein